MGEERESQKKFQAPPRVLGLGAVIAITYFCVSGGAYGLETEVFSAPPFYVLMLNLCVPWIWGFPQALVTAELSCAMPEDGGCVIWGSRAFGHFYGWLVGWMSFWACTFDTSVYPVLFTSYLSKTLNIQFGTYESWGISAGVVVVAVALNIYGADLVGVASYIFGILVLTPFIIICILGGKDLDMNHLGSYEGVDVQWAPLLATVLWTCSGWDDVGQLAGEIKEPAKNFPRAIIITMFIVVTMYVIPLGVGMCVDQNNANWTDGHFSAIASQLGGEWLRIFLGVGGMMSALGLINCLLCASARLTYCLSEKGYLPHVLSILTPKRETPLTAILFNGIFVAAMGKFSFQVLVEFDFLLYSFTIMLEYGAWMKLRIYEPDMYRPYRLPFSHGKRRIVSGIAFIAFPIALSAFNFYHATMFSQILFCGAILGACVLYIPMYFPRAEQAKQQRKLHGSELNFQEQAPLLKGYSIQESTTLLGKSGETPGENA